jgi:WD40 repeat protein
MLDHRLALDDWAIRNAKVVQADLDRQASEKTRDEAEQRYLTELRLSGGKFDEKVRGAKLTWDRYIYEEKSKREGVELAKKELHQAETVLKMHEIRAAIPGRIKTIYKKKGEAVKAMEPVMQIHGCDRIQVEGLLELQHLQRLQGREVKVVVEPTEAETPEQTFSGHLQEVTGVAVTRDAANPLIVSASEDGTVRVWDRSMRRERRVLRQPTAVRAVACTPPKSAANLILAGGADGKARLWDLDSDSDQPRELEGQHRGAINCVAFTPDGTWCLTAGDDREIMLWEVASGQLKYKFPAGHRAAVTSLRCTPRSQLVSAGRDNTLRLWTMGENGARQEASIDRRSGDLTDIGVSPDGKQVLFDKGKVLQVLTIPGGLTEGTLKNSSGATNFTTFALFSPDGQLILTSGASEGRCQIWRAPTPTTRGYELCQLIAPERSNPTCAVFSPDGKFVVTGTRDRQVLVWNVPSKEEIERQLSAKLTLVDRSVESGGRQMRIWAELPNPDERLIPGSTATLALYPQ